MVTVWEPSLGDVFLSMLWFFLFVIWIWLLITVFADIIRSEDMGGWGKALWTILVIVLPYLGVFVYLVARGRSMTERAARSAKLQQEQLRAYVEGVAAPPSPAEEIGRLAELHASGVLTAEEFAQAKGKLLA
ncbi:SHOCT domain-containing protein [Cellulomonas edaphi]|uniref:SHOCT domain-containing protein n=1 Tax=Cellulomonas edaphi TaxID=3053468 RepID=A0ABT7S5A2_9CELL|nr:SHOCT domain-containing protein [Cellulomons edaphi]MDM7830780.1 SHOCT domain-containing protein [Cellulomons edaphi]